MDVGQIITTIIQNGDRQIEPHREDKVRSILKGKPTERVGFSQPAAQPTGGRLFE